MWQIIYSMEYIWSVGHSLPLLEIHTSLAMPILVAVFACVGLALLLRAVAHAFILRGLRAPRMAHQCSPDDLALQAQSIRLPVGRYKTLFAWFVPVPGVSRSPAVLLMHGWGANASLMLPAVAPLHAAGYSVLLLDARCHGNSDDEPFTSLPRFAQDIEAGLNWLHRQPAVDGTRLAVIGHSVGAGAALLSATRRLDLRAVVSLGAFAHPYEVMRRYLTEFHIPYPVIGWYVLRHVQRVIGTRFDAIAPINTIPHALCPVLLVHGVDDYVVPFYDAQRLQHAQESQHSHRSAHRGVKPIEDSFCPQWLVGCVSRPTNQRGPTPRSEAQDEEALHGKLRVQTHHVRSGHRLLRGHPQVQLHELLEAPMVVGEGRAGGLSRADRRRRDGPRRAVVRDVRRCSVSPRAGRRLEPHGVRVGQRREPR
jgi:pimeloyl-ACP methyl ester carboxylesterase